MLGGCPTGMYQSNNQNGGAILPILSGIAAGLKYVQPFSKAKYLLEQHVSDKGKNSLGYKIAHGISNIGASLGLGQTSNTLRPISYSSLTYQPTTGSKTVKKQRGSGKRNKRRKKK